MLTLLLGMIYAIAKKSKTDHGTEELPETEYEHDEDDDFGPCGSLTYEKIVTFPCGTRVRKRQRQKVIYTHVTPVNEDKEKHFRQVLMLYSHWRNDESDLINGFQSFEESYHSKLGEISANKCQYEKCAILAIA